MSVALVRGTKSARGCGASVESAGTAGSTLAIRRLTATGGSESIGPAARSSNGPGRSTVSGPARQTTIG